MEHKNYLAYTFLQQLEIALQRWQEEYTHDLVDGRKRTITSVEGQAFNLPGHKYTKAFSLTYYMVREKKVQAYLLAEEVPKSGYFSHFDNLLISDHNAVFTAEHLLLFQQIIKSRTFYDIRNRAELTPEKFKLQSKYELSLQAYVEGWASKILNYTAYYADSLETGTLICFSLQLNLYNMEASVTGFQSELDTTVYKGKFELYSNALHINLINIEQSTKVLLTLTLLTEHQRIEDLNLMKGIFLSTESYGRKLKSGDFFLRKYVKKKHIKNNNIMEHLNIARSLAMNQQQVVLHSTGSRASQTFFDTPNFSNDILSTYVGTYLVYRIHNHQLETCIFRLYADYRATFQHPDFFGGAPMNCSISILNKASILELSILHQKTDQVIIKIIAKISDVKDLLISQLQVLIDLTNPNLSKTLITFNRNSTDATLVRPYLNVSKTPLDQISDFNDLKEVDKLTMNL